MLAREKLGSTAIGNKIAIPHARSKDVIHPLCAFISLQKGIDFNSIDNKPIQYVFGLIIPEEQNEEYLQILAWISKLCSTPEFIKIIEQNNNPLIIENYLLENIIK